MIHTTVPILARVESSGGATQVALKVARVVWRTVRSDPGTAKALSLHRAFGDNPVAVQKVVYFLFSHFKQQKQQPKTASGM